jgi:hypothetical protein
MEYWNTEKLIFKRILSIFYFILNSDKKGRSAKISEGRGMKASGSPFGVKIDEKKKIIIRFTLWANCMMI